MSKIKRLIMKALLDNKEVRKLEAMRFAVTSFDTSLKKAVSELHFECDEFEFGYVEDDNEIVDVNEYNDYIRRDGKYTLIPSCGNDFDNAVWDYEGKRTIDIDCDSLYYNGWDE